MTKRTILVVDDSAVMRMLNSSVLEDGGYAVLLAADGLAALEHVRVNQVDLVLTDWTMVPMDGCELTKELRKIPDFSEVPILVLSTISSAENKGLARVAGANGWLCKPIDPTILLSVVGTLLNSARPGQ